MSIQEAIDGLVASGEWAAAQVLVAELHRQTGHVTRVLTSATPPPPSPADMPVQGNWAKGLR